MVTAETTTTTTAIITTTLFSIINGDFKFSKEPYYVIPLVSMKIDG